MLRIICKSKIHNATVTDANLRYTGSITIDEKLLEEANIFKGEKVQIVNLNNGSRIETYVMAGKKGSGTICMNGAAARWAQVGDNVIIISYCIMNEDEINNFKPKAVFVGKKNRIIKIK
ncbi:MAG: aspartate 1-decarboxylase [Candidatus Omnitrophica bacterium]|nr:aspartate 1-decarboxylase [Candidatus Omnitrophota bacterium]